MTKCTYQKRARQMEILRRLDIDGTPHPNPVVASVPLDFLIPFYVEGFAHRWAIPTSEDLVNSNSDLYSIMENFLRYCNVQDMPDIKRGLFV